ncbi:MAG: DUF1467 family protein [Pseudomonadota bacterium]
MTITAAIVLFCSIWAVIFFMILPQGVVSQHEKGEIVPGTPASAPSDAQIVRKMIRTTIIALMVFAAIWLIIEYRLVTLNDIPWLTPPSAR